MATELRSSAQLLQGPAGNNVQTAAGPIVLVKHFV